MVCKCIEGIRYMRKTAEKTHGCSEREDANGCYGGVCFVTQLQGRCGAVGSGGSTRGGHH